MAQRPLNMPTGAAEYIKALTASPKFGPQVVATRLDERMAAEYAEGSPPVNAPLRDFLTNRGIEKLYSHQLEAIESILQGEDVIVATPTASGKSMIYNLPVVQMLFSGNSGTALYLYPLKALAQDQLRVFTEFTTILPGATHRKYGAIYDGDTSSYMRRRIREESVPVLMTNPEMVHLSLLPYHSNWVYFFQNLRYIVLDEVHTYRGVLGSHMAWVLRRLIRIALHYGSSPQFIMLSATIGNPGELAERLTGRSAKVITRSGAPASGKYMALLNPWDSAAYTASQLLEASIKRGLRAIVYTQSRKLTELINLWTRPRLGDKADKLSSYRAGFLPEERRDIEQRLSGGELLGVISTSALELGIDIGDLDVCILVGYPGSIMATRQRGGRVGRAQRDSAIVLIAQEDALDQYFMRKPEDFFERPVEAAVLNPSNTTIMETHLHCAAAELSLEASEPLITAATLSVINSLTEEGVLLQSGDGSRWFGTRKYPQRHVSLRGGGTQLSIVDSESGEVIGEIDSNRAMKECHPGSVYLHHANYWVVSKLDFEAREVIAGREKPNYFTRAMSSKNTSILEREVSGISYRGRVAFGRLRVTERVTGYQKRNNKTQKLISTFPLDLPEQTMETKGLWLEIPPVIKATLEQEKMHFMGGLHALEHAMIALFPLMALCDRNDIGGISCPLHEETEEATIFIYDGHVGGVGLCEEVFGKMDDLVAGTYEMVRSCGCENGCPSCVHSPKCGSGNRPIDKSACLRLLDLIMSGRPEDDAEFETRAFQSSQPDVPNETFRKGAPVQPSLHTPQSGLDELPERYGVFDLETQRSAQEVGGWGRAEKMGISVAVVYDSLLDGCVTYLEHEIPALVQHLQDLDIIIGFNNKRFDNRVLSAYTDIDLAGLPTIDLLEEVSNHLGYRLSLDRLAAHTLGSRKSADGLQALEWYKEGRIDLIQEYCRKDVEITRDLFLFGLENGHFLFKNKSGQLVRLPLRLDRAVRSALA